MTTEAPFSEIGIVGLGLIGGSIALRARDEWPGATIVGLDRGTIADDARQRGLVHGVARELADLATCDLIVMALPVAAMIDMMPAVGRLRTQAVITDVASTKRQVMATATAAGCASFVGGHPMAGSEQSGLQHANRDLFVGRPWLLVEGQSSAADCDRISRFVDGLGARPQWLDADAHDRAMAYVSHLPQVVSVALMNAAADAVGETGFAAAGPGFADMTRLASSAPDLWEGILATNADFLREALTRFLGSLPAAADLERERWVKDAFGRAGAARTRWRSIQAPDGKR